jgi:hypothetical protein
VNEPRHFARAPKAAPVQYGGLVPDAHPDALLSSPSHYHMADKVAVMSGLEDHQHLLADEQVTGAFG